MATTHFLEPLLRRGAEPRVLWNADTDRAVAMQVEGAFDSASRRRGLLGRDAMAPLGAIILAPCNGVHTAFMRFAIDILFVRRDGTVVKAQKAMKPWRLALSPRAFATIELPVGAIEASGTQVGHRLRLILAHGYSDSGQTTVRSQPDT
jgi:uncharacterized membrane protein (UPF0127 family)